MTADSSAVNLLRRLLTYNPAKRITAAEALEHPYFRQVSFIHSICSNLMLLTLTGYAETVGYARKNCNAVLVLASWYRTYSIAIREGRNAAEICNEVQKVLQSAMATEMQQMERSHGCIEESLPAS